MSVQEGFLDRLGLRDELGIERGSNYVSTFYDHPDCEALIRAADEQLYHAKHAGRNRVEPASAEPLLSA